MKLQDLQRDDAVLVELGRRLAQWRIDGGMTQAALAKRAGVGKRTLERVEAGETTQAGTLIRLIRALGLLARLDGLFPEPEVRPRLVVKEGRERRRRAPRKKPGGSGEAGAAAGPWRWGDER
jgi:transcriptional regulator with XRE-family HTH domain